MLACDGAGEDVSCRAKRLVARPTEFLEQEAPTLVLNDV